MSTDTLQAQFSMSAYVLQKNLQGITHEESVRQFESGGNYINWILGHIVRTRVEVLPLIGVESPYSLDDFGLYRGNPDAVDASELSLDDLVEHFEVLQGLLDDGLSALTAENLSDPAPVSPTGNPDETMGTLLATIAYHEAYHAGQIGTLRRAIGRPGVIKVSDQA